MCAEQSGWVYRPARVGAVRVRWDGERQSNSATVSNVVKFKNRYQDGQIYYITGPGTLDPATGIHNPLWKEGSFSDAAEAFTGKARIAAMVKYLDSYSNDADDNASFNIDIVGFSRGAA